VRRAAVESPVAVGKSTAMLAHLAKYKSKKIQKKKQEKKLLGEACTASY
jgi:hypothetical protein